MIFNTITELRIARHGKILRENDHTTELFSVFNVSTILDRWQLNFEPIFDKVLEMR